jgi:hypothetical protein
MITGPPSKIYDVRDILPKNMNTTTIMTMR